MKHLVLEPYYSDLSLSSTLFQLFSSKAADGFLFVCQCDTGRIIYVSDSVTAVLNQTQGASVLGLTGQTPTALSNTTTNNSNSINLNKPPTSSSDSKLCSNTSDSSPASVSDLVSSHLCSSQRRNSPTHLTNTICSSPAPGRILDLKTGTVKKEGHQCMLISHVLLF
ncbi:unnamed protein product [Trichobilharzia regenti]|nr:unnamed protein product [Trichobilharzia regenti]